MAGIFSRIFKPKEKRAYEGASKAKRLRKWRAPSSSANTEITKSNSILRNRARDLVRNNPLAAKSIQVITSNIVGHGIKTTFSGRNSEFLQKKWDKWAMSNDCDSNGEMNFYSMQSLVMRSVVEGGECLSRKIIDSKKEVPLSYQLMEGDFLSLNMLDKKSNIMQGVEMDDMGRVKAYHIHKSHPYDTGLFNKNISETIRVKKEDLIHVFRTDRIGQNRGVTWFTPVMVRLKDVDEFIDATIMKQKVSACFAGFVTNNNADFLSESDVSDSDIEMAGMIEPATIEELPAGRDIKFPNPPSVENFKEFQSILGHNIASGLGISYEALTGDLSEVNFSSARMGWIEMGRNINNWRNNILINKFIERVVKDYVEVCSIKYGLNVSDITWSHTPPKREMIDPVKETNSLVKNVRAGTMSLSEAIKSLGKDPDKVFEQIKIDNEKLDKLNIILDSDPRKVTGAGIQQSEVFE